MDVPLSAGPLGSNHGRTRRHLRHVVEVTRRRWRASFSEPTEDISRRRRCRRPWARKLQRAGPLDGVPPTCPAPVHPVRPPQFMGGVALRSHRATARGDTEGPPAGLRSRDQKAVRAVPSPTFTGHQAMRADFVGSCRSTSSLAAPPRLSLLANLWPMLHGPARATSPASRRGDCPPSGPMPGCPRPPPALGRGGL